MRLDVLSLIAVLAVVGSDQDVLTPEEAARSWAETYNLQAQVVYSRYGEAHWTYYTNMTLHNKAIANVQKGAAAAFLRAQALTAQNFDWANFEDKTLRREFSKIVDDGSAIIPSDNVTKLSSEMQRIYRSAKVCNRPGDLSGKCYALNSGYYLSAKQSYISSTYAQQTISPREGSYDPPQAEDLTIIMASSTDWDELLWAWQGWMNASGRPMMTIYDQLSRVLNKEATENGFSDSGAYWRSWYESDTFRQECEDVLTDLRPLYEQLHAFVRLKLAERYSTHTFPSEGHIPAHLLGNMWARNWDRVNNLVRPYPHIPRMDVVDELRKQGYDAHRMVSLANDFFVSLGYTSLPHEFWNKSMMSKPVGRNVSCEPSAWDFYNRKDFRIAQCTEVTSKSLVTTHSLLAQIHYFLQYKHLPVRLRDGANPGFVEAVGKAIGISVWNAEHLKAIGLLPNFVQRHESDMNALMKQILDKVPFIPFAYIIDQWRWDTLSGNITRSEYNRRWWDARCKYQGVSPPVVRTSEDFDPGTWSNNIRFNKPYIKAFVSHVIKFQILKGLCETSGNTKPLHKCTLLNSKTAGTKLENMMKLGASVSWQDALEIVTGSRKMSAAPLIEYFQPLLDWLKKQNKGKPVGWTDACPPETLE